MGYVCQQQQQQQQQKSTRTATTTMNNFKVFMVYLSNVHVLRRNEWQSKLTATCFHVTKSVISFESCQNFCETFKNKGYKASEHIKTVNINSQIANITIQHDLKTRTTNMKHALFLFIYLFIYLFILNDRIRKQLIS